MRPLALVLFLAASAVVSGCGPTVKCGPGSCSGCCDSSGVCQSGNANTACGTGGLICGACFVGQSCNFGLCSSAGTGGGSSGGTGGGLGGGTGGGTGGGFGGGTGGGSGSAYETWCSTSYVPDICDMAVRCGIYQDASVCRLVSNSYAGCATTPATRDGRTTFDSNAAASCLSLINSSGACDTYDYTACAGAQRGTGTLNSACYGAFECESGLYCSLGTTCPGVCRPVTPVGQTNPTGAMCADGSFPYGTVCTEFVPAGQSCAPANGQSVDRQCVSSAYCSTTKVCTPKKLSGQACSQSYVECAGLLQCIGGVCGGMGALNAPCDTTRRCRFDLVCSTANVCVPAGTVNSPCTAGYGQCRPDLICDIPMGTSSGTCQVTRGLGGSCTYTGYQCGILSQTLYCTATSSNMSGVCALKKGNGAACASSTECVGGTCTNSMCGGCVDPTP
ncbi:MAG: hypothetical protein Q8K32_27245 [Archangium sp.]|nr:hypothetical protein [Archangium sp.]